MNKLPMNQEQAFELVKKYNSNSRDIIHYLESEAIMKSVAEKLGEEVDYWGMLGLLHDIDWGITKENSKEHLAKAPEILRKNGFDEEFISIIISHGYGYDCAGLKDKKRTKLIEYALAASETMTGLIHSYAIMRGNKISDMKLKGLKKKFKEKSFAAGVNREEIKECEKIGISLEEFFELSIKSIKNIKDKVGLI